MNIEFYKDGDKNRVWWVYTPETIGMFQFSFDKKKIYNLFGDYPDKLSKDEKEIFDKENPFWQEFFEGKK